MGNSVDVRSVVHLKGRKSVTETVECDMLGYSGSFEPVLERRIDIVSLEILEYQAGGSFPTEFVGLVGQWQSRLGIRFLGPDPYAPTAVLCPLYITPSKS